MNKQNRIFFYFYNKGFRFLHSLQFTVWSLSSMNNDQIHRNNFGTKAKPREKPMGQTAENIHQNIHWLLMCVFSQIILCMFVCLA